MENKERLTKQIYEDGTGDTVFQGNGKSIKCFYEIAECTVLEAIEKLAAYENISTHLDYLKALVERDKAVEREQFGKNTNWRGTRCIKCRHTLGCFEIEPLDIKDFCPNCGQRQKGIGKNE